MKKFLIAIRAFFKGSVSVDTIFTTVASGIDNLGLTSQEKAEGVKDFVKDTLSENTERSRARRAVAKLIIYNYLLVFWVAVILVFFNPDITKLIIEITGSFSMGYAFLAVIAFYFGGYYLGKTRKKKERGKQE